MMGENESRCPLIRCLISPFADFVLSSLLASFITIDVIGYCYVCIVSMSMFLVFLALFRWLIFSVPSVVTFDLYSRRVAEHAQCIIIVCAAVELYHSQAVKLPYRDVVFLCM